MLIIYILNHMMNITEGLGTIRSLIPEGANLTSNTSSSMGFEVPPEYVNNKQVLSMIVEVNNAIDNVWIMIVAVHVLAM